MTPGLVATLDGIADQLGALADDLHDRNHANRAPSTEQIHEVRDVVRRLRSIRDDAAARVELEEARATVERLERRLGK